MVPKVLHIEILLQIKATQGFFPNNFKIVVDRATFDCMTAQDLANALTKNRTKSNVDFLVNEVFANPMNWDTWFEIYRQTSFPVSWYMTWWLSHYIEADQQMGNQYQRRIWDEFNAETQVSIKRDFWKILTRIEINEDLAGLAYERAIKVIAKQNEEVAVRAYAMEVATNISLNWPELAPEVVMILEDLRSDEPASIQVRKNKFLGEMKKLTSPISRLASPHKRI